MTVERRRDWRARLDAYLDGLTGRTFCWGSIDCALFAADAVLAMTDMDLAADFRGKYSTAFGASRAIKKAGFWFVSDVAAARLPELPVALLRLGDVAVVFEHDQPALALCNGPTLLCMSPVGKVSLSRARAVRGFGVG